jgi:DNA-binding response OmpR family regulator
MPTPILIVSRDASLSVLRHQTLKSAGFSTVHVADIGLALTMSRFDVVRTIVLDWTFSTEEQESLISHLRWKVSPVHVICVGRESDGAEELVRACEHCARQRGIGKTHYLDGRGREGITRTAS